MTIVGGKAASIENGVETTARLKEWKIAMKQYRKKPVIIEALQWFPGVAHQGVCEDSTKKLTDFLPGSAPGDLPAYYVTTIHEQRAYLVPGDWILPEPKEGRFYPCKPEVFAKTYDPA